MAEKIWNEICRRLDEFYESSDIRRGKPPSSMLRGALAIMDNREISEEWMEASANSIRDIFYKRVTKMKILLTDYGSIYDKEKGKRDIEDYYGFFSAIGHHDPETAGKNKLVGGTRKKPVKITPELYECIVRQFGDVVHSALRRQMDVHDEIDRILERSPDNVNQVRKLINLNLDAFGYFFSNTNELWLDWLWREGFLNIFEELKDEADETRCDWKVAFLMRMATISPKKVTAIIAQIQISSEMSDSVAVDCLFKICSKLPAKQLAELTEKIRDEKWVVCRGRLHSLGELEYERIIRKLFEGEEYDALLKFFQAILTLRNRHKSYPFLTDNNPLCFDISASTKIFNYLSSVSDEFTEQAFNIIRETVANIIYWGSRGKREGSNEYEEDNMFDFSSVNFFCTDPEIRMGKTPYREVYEVMLVTESLAKRLIEQRRDNPDDTRRIYDLYVDALPKSNSAMFRFRIYLLSLFPEIFMDNLKYAFFRIFDIDNYCFLTGGAEYKFALAKCFVFLYETDKRDYVKQAICHFANGKIEGSEVFSAIESQLTEKERQQVIEAGFEIDPNFQPRPSIEITTTSGWIKPQGPVSQEDLAKMSVSSVVRNLKDEWSPQKLEGWNVCGPINVEGVGDLLANNMPDRLQEYVDCAISFFEPNVLDEYYTCSYLRGIRETITSHKELAVKIDWWNLMKFFTMIVEVGEEKCIRSGSLDWFIKWKETHLMMAGVLMKLLVNKNGSDVIDFRRYRGAILSMIRYLLLYPDPPLLEGEEFDASRIKRKYEILVNNPYDIAINSVRGKALYLFAIFTRKDTESRKETDGVKIADDVKEIYEDILKKENTRALMFLFGFLLVDFYRDKNWLRDLLPQIFPVNKEKKNLYTAAWEGYLSRDRNISLFPTPDIQELYARGISLTDTDYPKQEHYQHPDKGIATHFALAFIHDEGFLKSHLFGKFWKEGSDQSQWYFIYNLGRISISEPSDNMSKLMASKPEIKERLISLWDELLQQKSKYPGLFTAFGTWVNPDVDIFEPIKVASLMKRTLEETSGKLGWYYGIEKSIPRFTVAAPKETLRIIDMLLLEGRIRDKEKDKSFSYWNVDLWQPVLEILHDKPETKSGVEALINKLIGEGGEPFWVLKNIFK